MRSSWYSENPVHRKERSQDRSLETLLVFVLNVDDRLLELELPRQVDVRGAFQGFVLGHMHVDGEDMLENPPRSLGFLLWDLLLHRTGHRLECLCELGRVGRRPDGGGDEKVVLFLNHLAIQCLLH